MDPQRARREDRASFGVRFVAALIDGLLLGIAGFVLQIAVGQVLGQLLNVLLVVGYFSYLEGGPSGQTVGKRLVHIRVVDLESGGPIGPMRAFVRYVGRVVSAIALLLGYFWMLWDPEAQTWHDKLAGCVVVPTSMYPVERWP